LKIAVIYNRESKKVINLFGISNREKYGLKAIRQIVDALKKGGHHVVALEGDKDLVERLEEFLPRVLKGERPGMAFNLSYGIQGQARYTHVPSILEMVGIPYVGSGPLAHSLALDKVVAKMLFRQNGLPTPEFAVLDGPGFPAPGLDYPLIVKPKNEAVSLGLRVVKDEKELRDAADEIFGSFRQPVLVEQYIDGREINVGLLGNSPPQPFAPAEIIFDGKGLPIYTYDDKTHRSGRTISFHCPARISAELAGRAQELAVRAFRALGCYDCARVDLRLDRQGNLYLLEVNSLPSLGEHGSYVEAAGYMGLDFTALVNRMVEVASARYFGTPAPPHLIAKARDSASAVFTYLVENRDRIEHCVQEWTTLSSRTEDPVGIQMAVRKLDRTMKKIGLEPSRTFSREPDVYVWKTSSGLKDGTLLIGHLDVPLNPVISAEPFHLDPEWLYGEGIGVSRAPIVMMEFALRALRAAHCLKGMPLGVLYYTDEGLDCRYSAELICQAAEAAGRVLVLRPGNMGDRVVTQRRGQRRYRLTVEGRPLRLGHSSRSTEVMRWAFSRLEEVTRLSSRKDLVSVSTVDVRTEAFPMLLPHRVVATLLLSYLDRKTADRVENTMREMLKGKGLSSAFTLLSERYPMKERRVNARLARKLRAVAGEWDIPLNMESSLWPSVAGMVPSATPVVCGVGPVAKDLYTSSEAVRRISLVQRTLLLAEFLLKALAK
jgi:D-alanine-D-alanine ligase